MVVEEGDLIYVTEVGRAKLYHIYPTPPLRKDMTLGQFF